MSTQGGSGIRSSAKKKRRNKTNGEGTTWGGGGSKEGAKNTERGEISHWNRKYYQKNSETNGNKTKEGRKCPKGVPRREKNEGCTAGDVTISRENAKQKKKAEEAFEERGIRHK